MIDGKEVEYEFCCGFEYEPKPWERVEFLGTGKMHSLNGQRVNDERELYFYRYEK
jgi:hypothetical protein